MEAVECIIPDGVNIPTSQVRSGMEGETAVSIDNKKSHDNQYMENCSFEVDALLLLPGEGQGDLRGSIIGSGIESTAPYTLDGSGIDR